METSRKLAVTVGLFIVAAFAVAAGVLVVMGSDAMLFSDKITYHAQFTDVGGLREGALVRLGGRDVGDVKDVSFGPIAEGAPTLVVTMRVRKEYGERVRQDSVARIGTQGLVGDKLIELTMGSPQSARLEDGGWLVGQSASDPNHLIAAATDAAEHAKNILGRFDQMSRELTFGGTMEELDATVRGLHRIVDAIEHGSGSAHEIVYGKTLVAEARGALATYQRVGARLEETAGRADKLVAAVDPDKVRKAADDLTGVVADMRAGRGTLGGLLEDPTLYEETKRILVNIERNRVLKALARFVISEESDDKVMDASPRDVHPRPLTQR